MTIHEGSMILHEWGSISKETLWKQGSSMVLGLPLR